MSVTASPGVSYLDHQAKSEQNNGSITAISTYYQVWKMLAWIIQNTEGCIKKVENNPLQLYLVNTPVRLTHENFLSVSISVQSCSQYRVLKIASKFKTNSQASFWFLFVLVVYLNNPELLYLSFFISTTHAAYYC